jgi:leucyl aminopeptidase
MPLPKEYKDMIKSSIADVSNITKSKYGGAITAALFLEEFVPDYIEWAHLDIAGPAYAEHETVLCPIGGTGYGIGTLLTYIASYKQKKRS